MGLCVCVGGTGFLQRAQRERAGGGRGCLFLLCPFPGCCPPARVGKLVRFLNSPPHPSHQTLFWTWMNCEAAGQPPPCAGRSISPARLPSPRRCPRPCVSRRPAFEKLWICWAQFLDQAYQGTLCAANYITRVHFIFSKTLSTRRFACRRFRKSTSNPTLNCYPLFCASNARRCHLYHGKSNIGMYHRILWMFASVFFLNDQ